MNRRIVLASIIWSAVAIQSAARAARAFTLTIQRNMTCWGDETIGRLLVDGAELSRTLELPWRDDQQNISRVQAGTYAAKIRQDGTKGWRIALLNVPNHKNVELHVGNFARETFGCVLVGLSVSTLNDPQTGKPKCAVLRSADAISAIQGAMQKASDDGISSQDLDITVMIVD